MERRTGVARAVALALGCALVGIQPVASTAAPAPVKILIVGDSVAQGSAGDWTWRYRLWQELQQDGVAVDFVGPRADLMDNVASQAGSQAYADPGFDRDHAARWGMLLSEPDVSMTSLMEEFHPDLVIETRGVNDIFVLGARPDELGGLVADEVAEARAVDPDVDFVVARLPQQWIRGVDDYNGSLAALAAGLSRTDSSIVAADTGQGFTEYVDTWDPAHLSATGEVKMAAGVANALAELGVGDGAGPPPVVRNGHWGGATLAVEPGERSARLTWTGPPGAAQEYVWLRDVSAGEDWTRLPFPVPGTSWVGGGLVAGHRYDFRLQAVKGSIVADDFSAVVGAVPRAPEVPAPTPPPAPPGQPGGVVVRPGSHRLDVSWGPVPGATAYDVTWTGRKLGMHGSATVVEPAVAIDYVLAGESYDVTVTARNAAGSGPVATTVGVPRGPRVPAPARLRAAQIGAHRAQLTWRLRSEASSYDVQVRRDGHWTPVRNVVALSTVVRRLPRGAATFRVRSWHQFVPGPWSRVVRVRMR